MSHVLKIALSDAAYGALERQAQQLARLPEQVAAATLEKEFGATSPGKSRDQPIEDMQKQSAQDRFMRHFGAVDLGRATGVDNESIDADLTRAYADNHEGS